MVAWSAYGPAKARAGSPGTECETPKVIAVTPTSTGMVTTIRLTMRSASFTRETRGGRRPAPRETSSALTLPDLVVVDEAVVVRHVLVAVHVRPHHRQVVRLVDPDGRDVLVQPRQHLLVQGCLPRAAHRGHRSVDPPVGRRGTPAGVDDRDGDLPPPHQDVARVRDRGPHLVAGHAERLLTLGLLQLREEHGPRAEVDVQLHARLRCALL